MRGLSNHFGSRSKRGTEVAAILYSLIESAKLNDLNPVVYLRICAKADLRGDVVPLPHELAALPQVRLTSGPPPANAAAAVSTQDVPRRARTDQGPQYGSDDWVRFCRSHDLVPSMSPRGNCFDNAVAESFFSSLKKDRVRRRVHRARDDARADLFDYIEVFYNRKRRQSLIGGMSPAAFEEAVRKAG